MIAQPLTFLLSLSRNINNEVILTALSYSLPLVDHCKLLTFGRSLVARVTRLTGQQQSLRWCTGAVVNGLWQLYGNPTNLTQGLSNQCFPPLLNVCYGLQTLHIA